MQRVRDLECSASQAGVSITHSCPEASDLCGRQGENARARGGRYFKKTVFPRHKAEDIHLL